MIPKVIHYCWFGGNPLPELSLRCIESWKKYCPDYEIIEWNESNYNIESAPLYVRQAYEAKKWAFVSDYVRLDLIYKYGGIYLDTDVELISSLDPFLDNDCFMGLETDIYIATGLGFGAISRHKAIKELMGLYDDMPFVNKDGTLNLTTCPIITTDYYVGKGFIREDKKQEIENTVIYPSEYFCPKDYITHECSITRKTVSIHHFDASWLDDESIYYRNLKIKLYKFMPLAFAKIIAVFITSLKYYGLKWPVYIISKLDEYLSCPKA